MAWARTSDPLRPSRYEAPLAWDGRQESRSAEALRGWLNEAVREGEWFLKGQAGHQYVPMSYRLMYDLGFDTDVPDTLSKVNANFVKRDIRELVESLANIRPIVAFTSDNPDFDDQSFILNRCWLSWYTDAMVDRDIRKALQFAAVEGTGYLLVDWDADYWRPGKGDIRLEALGVDSVLPIQIPPDWDLQKAYAVVIRREVPITAVAARYPHLKDRLLPDENIVPRFRRLLNRVSNAITPTVHNTYGTHRGYRSEDPLSSVMVTVYDIYILDVTANMTGQELVVEEGAPWTYHVPYYKGPVYAGYNDPEGRPAMREANYWDSRMWPLRRHITMTSNCVLRDSTNRYWHGQVPIIPFRMDDWPFEYCGIPATKESGKCQDAVRSLFRAKDDSNNARLRPSLMYDRGRTNKEVAELLDPRRGGQSVGVNNMGTEIFRPVIDSRYYTLDNDTLQFIQWQREQIRELMGIPDVRSLAKAAQIPSGDTIEKAAELAGPLATGISRNMERSVSLLGEQFKALVFEFYSARRRFHLLGPDGLTREDYDFEPSSLIPDSVPGLPPLSSKWDRARAHMANFQFRITPNSIYQQTQSTRKLFILQLARAGMPISPYTILEMFDVPNPGRPPKGVSSEIDKWKAWQGELVKLEVEKQMAMLQAQAAMSPLGMALGAAGVPLPGAGGGAPGQPEGGPGQGAPEGRPPTGQKPPHLERKSGEQGERTVVSES